MKRFLSVFLFFANFTLLAQIPQNVPLNGLLCWYPFNGNTNDQTSGSNHFTNLGATLSTDRFNNPNSAYSFDGISNYLTRSNFSLGNTYTVSVWQLVDVYTTGTLGQAFFSYGYGGFNGFSMKYNNERLEVIMHGVVANGTNSTFVPTLSKWYNYVLVRNGNEHSVYVNGILNSKGSQNPITTPANFLNIGAARDSPSNQVMSNFTKGKIDDIGVWNRALSQAEIEGLYSGNGICYTNVTVTDTLIINTGSVQNNPLVYNTRVKIYPNPSVTQLNIDFFSQTNTNGYSAKFFNSAGQQVFNIQLSQGITTLPITSLGVPGIYRVHLVDNLGNTLEVKTLSIM